jgi:hypothetical protein
MRENREALSTPDTKLCSGRLEKAMSQKSNMHVVRESDSRVDWRPYRDKFRVHLRQTLHFRFMGPDAEAIWIDFDPLQLARFETLLMLGPLGFAIGSGCRRLPYEQPSNFIDPSQLHFL